ncbi:MAG: hypothetical protein ACI4OG_02600 [Bacilli bacterium]
MEEENKKKKFSILDIVRNKQYYAIANLVFYFILILLLVIMFRTSSSDTNTNNNSSNNGNQNTEVSQIDGFDGIKQKNFDFKYTLKVDLKETVYEGKERENKIFFKDITNSKEYFIKDDVFLVKEKEQYVLTDSPVRYFNYLDVDIIESIISKSTKEEDEYIITIDEFANIISDNDKTSNDEIYIELEKQNGIITKVTMDLTNYAELIDSKINDVKLTLQYYNFNLIEDFDIK